MLAALLLNLDVGGDGGNVIVEPERKKRKKQAEREFDLALMPDVRNKVSAIVAQMDEAVEQVKQTKPVKALKKLKPKLEQYSQDQLQLPDMSELLRELSMREFELRQSAFQSNQQDPQMVLILDSLTLLISYLEQDEEDVLILMLSL